MTSTRIEDFRLEDWLPYWLSPNDLIGLLAGMAVLIAFAALWQALRGPDPYARRYLEILQRRESLRREMLDVKRGRQRVSASSLMTEVVTRLDLLRSQRATDARNLLAQ